MGGPEMAPHTPQPLVAPRRSRGAPRSPNARRAPAKPWRASTPTARRAPVKPWRASTPTARRAPAKPWRASTPQPLVAPRRSRGAPRYTDRSSRPGEAVARLDPRPLVAPRRSRGAPRPPHARRAPAKPWRAPLPRQAPDTSLPRPARRRAARRLSSPHHPDGVPARDGPTDLGL